MENSIEVRQQHAPSPEHAASGPSEATGQSLAPPPFQLKASEGVVQRKVKVTEGKAGKMLAKPAGSRPPGLGGKQGDHTTPYKVLQDQVANAITGATLEEAWGNLRATLAIYKTLPGWDQSTVFVRETMGDDVEVVLAAEGDVAALHSAANYMLRLRNQ
ncbi:MAG: hypothetical protein AAF570_07345, partial [Bacteroidota bacterium]